MKSALNEVELVLSEELMSPRRSSSLYVAIKAKKKILSRERNRGNSKDVGIMKGLLPANSPHEVEDESIKKCCNCFKSPPQYIKYMVQDDPEEEKYDCEQQQQSRSRRKTTIDQLNTDSTLQDIHSFAFVWFKIGPPSADNKEQANKSTETSTDIEQMNLKPQKFTQKKKRDNHPETAIQETEMTELHSNNKRRDSVNVEEETKKQEEETKNDADQQQEEHQNHFYGILAALNVFDRLHQQPCDDHNPENGVMNVELMGYDQYYRNLSLGVDTYHDGSWKNGKYMLAFQILIQCLLLPIFILLPLKDLIDCCGIMRCCCTHYRPTPRYRPQGASSDKRRSGNPWKDLDIIEQIPYDISAVWRRVIKKKAIGFPVSIILLTVVYVGPLLYRYDQAVANLSFFDCYGPAIFYGLWIVTIICWACSFRGLIGPKEHLLFYNKMVAQRSKNVKKPATDFDILTHLSEPQSLTVMNYAVLRGFLETKYVYMFSTVLTSDSQHKIFFIRTPTHNLLSERSLKCCGRTPNKYSDREWSEERKRRIKKWVFVSAAIIIYFCVQNLEDLQAEHRPVYVDKHKVHNYTKR